MADAKRVRRAPRIARFYYDGPLQSGTDLELDKKASHHLVTVLRTALEDELILFNGDGTEYRASLVATGQRNAGKRAVLRIGTSQQGLPESPLAISLVQCVSRTERMDISLRQAVELGVNTVQPVYSRHSIKVTDERRALKKQEHWHSIVVSACEQSGRAVMPVLTEAMTFTKWLQVPMAADDTRFVLSPSASNSLTQQSLALADTCAANKLTLIIGPESGLDHDEIQAAIDAGSRPVHMGGRILRTETAGPACIVLLQSLLGDLRT